VQTEILGLLTALVSGGLIAGIVAIYKARPERDSVIVTATQTATVILQGLNTQLHQELAVEREKNSLLERKLRAVLKFLRDHDIEWDPDTVQ